MNRIEQQRIYRQRPEVRAKKTAHDRAFKAAVQQQEGEVARACLALIQEYWRVRGHEVALRIETVAGEHRHPALGIRSNMVNGLPRP